MSGPRSTILITPRLCKAARAILNWTAAELAEYSGIGVTTVRIYESEARDVTRLTLVVLERTFADAGIEFLPDGIRVRELEAA